MANISPAVAGLIGAAGGAAAGAGVVYLLTQGQVAETVNEAVDKAEAGQYDFDTFIHKLYQYYWRSDVDESGYAYWMGRYNNPNDLEFSTNRFANSSVPITQTGSRPSILACLLARSF